MKRSLILAAVALAATLAAPKAQAAEGARAPIEMSWPHEGFFGSFDPAALQRGLQVYRAVCQGCHGMEYVAFRTLSDIGYEEEQVQALAAEYTIEDGPNDQGDMFERPGEPSDYFPMPFANEQAAAAAYGKAPPDLSLITKARPHGSDYLYSLLVGYEDPPADVEVPPGSYYNLYYPGNIIAMPSPLMPDIVEYADGTPATVHQMSSDVTQFLTWAAEPKLETRKETGVKATLFLVVVAGLMYAYKRKIWQDVH